MTRSESKIAVVESKAYQTFLDETKQRILSTRLNVARAACREQTDLYMWTGKKIVTNQEKHGWGKSVVEKLSGDLGKEFPNSKFGFSPRNLWDMRRFFLEYNDHPKLRQAVAEIPWGHNLLIMSKVKDLNE